VGEIRRDLILSIVEFGYNVMKRTEYFVSL
jgi:hypothetical protein